MPDVVEGKETRSDRSGAAADPPTRAAPSVVILGADALLAAHPATAVQLAHACLRIGFQAVVPASWGDELVSGGCLRHLASRRGGGDVGPTIFCACPYVAHRLLAVGPDLEPFLASFVAPPVAVARYLRALYAPTRLRLTYVGRCPGAADDTIDARLTPHELLSVLAERRVDLVEQPRVFDSVIPPDRRRFLSQPGGLPALDVLRRVDPERRVIEVTGPELATELAQHLLSRADVLIDVSARVGCACSGAVADGAAEDARAGVTVLEPPRATSAVVDDRVPVAIELPLPPTVRNVVEVVPSVAERRTSGASRAMPLPDPAPPSAAPADSSGAPGGRRRSPGHGVTVRQSGAVPTTRSGEGRALPRAYVARRGAGARGRGPSTPPRGEASRRLDASAAGGERGARGSGSPYNEGMGAPPAPPVPAPSGEVLARPRQPAAVSASVGSAPHRAEDPHGAEAMVVGETAAAQPAGASEAEVLQHAAPPPEPRGPSPISGPIAVRDSSFRVRTTTFARMAVGAARRRRATVAALLAVALLSASVGVLAGRWLAAGRATSGAVEQR